MDPGLVFRPAAASLSISRPDLVPQSFVQPMEMLDNSRQKQALIEQLQKVTAELLYLGTSLEEIRGALESAGQKKTGGAAK
ncbi:MAG TPA: hypothetical protein VHS59_08360 [Bacillota bacterium]|nr:hypothetical protein [Bacillota bacterium]